MIANANDNQQPKRTKPGAPKGNVNGQTTGISRLLTVGEFPQGGTYIRRSVQLLKREIEAELAQRGVTLGLREKAAINSACVAEGMRLLLWRYLRRSGGDDADGFHEPDGEVPIASDGHAEALTATPEQQAAASVPKRRKRSRSRLSIMQRVSVIERMMRAIEFRDRQLAKLGIAAKGEPQDGHLSGLAADLYGPRSNGGSNGA